MSFATATSQPVVVQTRNFGSFFKRASGHQKFMSSGEGREGSERNEHAQVGNLKNKHF